MPNMVSFFRELEGAASRPEPFEFYTADRLWSDPHISARMLEYHLDPDVNLASRTLDFIESSCDWIRGKFRLRPGVSVADFGCGPGLYTSRFAATGADVTGIDLSPRSLDHARRNARELGRTITYVQADYLSYETESRFDLITLIFCDLCPLSPQQRGGLLRKFRAMLGDGGALLLDVCSLAAFDRWKASNVFERRLMNGFWSEDDYFGFRVSFKYARERITLDKYTIVEPGETWQVYNWLQYYSVESLREELEAAGLKVIETYSDVAGTPFSRDADQFAVVAVPA